VPVVSYTFENQKAADDGNLYSATTGLNTLNGNTSHPIIFTTDNKIHVISAEPYHIYNIAGNLIPNKTTLPIGVYIVKTGMYTTKVLVP